MAPPPRITPAEWELLEAVWSLGGAPSVREVVDATYPNGEKAYTTVQTIMNTLVEKGMLRRKKVGLVNFYRPTRKRDTMRAAETRTLLSRVFGGSASALASSLLDLDGLDLDELQRIKRMLREKEQELKESPEESGKGGTS